MWRAEEWFSRIFSYFRSDVETNWAMSITLVLQAGLETSMTKQLRCQYTGHMPAHCIQLLQPLKLAQTADMWHTQHAGRWCHMSRESPPGMLHPNADDYNKRPIFCDVFKLLRANLVSKVILKMKLLHSSRSFFLVKLAVQWRPPWRSRERCIVCWWWLPLSTWNPLKPHSMRTPTTDP